MMIVALMACSHIDEDERLIYVKPVAASRNVLIEDFTGQRCVNWLITPRLQSGMTFMPI